MFCREEILAFCRSLLQELRWQSKAILMSIAISSSGMTVRVRNISDLAPEREVREFFSFFGQIKHVESDCESLLISFSICSASCFLCFSCAFPPFRFVFWTALWFWPLVGGCKRYSRFGEDCLRHIQRSQGSRDCASPVSMDTNYDGRYPAASLGSNSVPSSTRRIRLSITICRSSPPDVSPRSSGTRNRWSHYRFF